VVTNLAIFGPGPGTLSNALFSGESLITFASNGVIPMPKVALGFASGTRVLDAQGHSVVLDGQRTTNGIFLVHGGQLKLTGLTFSNCLSTAVLVESGAGLIATNCVFTRNDARSGNNPNGGSLHSAGSMLLVGCSFVGNAAQSGGAIYVAAATPMPTTEMIGCVLRGNSSTFGGGGILSEASLTLRDCLLSTNSCGGDGGGGAWLVGTNAPVTVSGCTFSGNLAARGPGGAIVNYDTVLSVENSTFVGNRAPRGDIQGWGGAICNEYKLAVRSSTFSGNFAGMIGGGVFNIGDATVENSTFSGNWASGFYGGSGGAILSQQWPASPRPATLKVNHCTLSGNSGMDLNGGSGLDIGDGSTLTISHTLLAHGTNGNLVGNGGSGTLPIGSILNPTLALNGGSTRTHALVPGSLAINAGGGVANEVQSVSVIALNPGTFSLAFNGQSTGGLPGGATAAQVQAALSSLSTLGGVGGSVTVTGGGGSVGTYTVTFGGSLAYANQPALVATGSGGVQANVGTVTEGSGPATDQRGPGFPRVAGQRVDIGAYELPVADMDLLGGGVGIPDGDTTPSLAEGSDFGSASVSSGTVVRTFTIRNTGTVALKLTGTPKVVVSGAHASDFAVTLQPASPVAAGGSTTFQVTFDPSATGLRTATLSLANDSPNENPYNVAIQGTGVDPEINVTGNGVRIPDGDTTPSVTDGTDFGTVEAAGGAGVRTFTIQNLGNALLNLTGTPKVAVSGAHAGDFTVTAQPVSPVPANGAVTFQVTFDPSLTGLRTAVLSIANSDPSGGESLYNFAIQGTGTGPCSPSITVLNAEDSGAGSLRQALVDLCPGGTIGFDTALNGRTILLSSGPLVLHSNLTILGPGPGSLTLAGNGMSRVIQVNPGAIAVLAGLGIANGAGGIDNAGTLTVSNCAVSDNIGSDHGGGLDNRGTLTVLNSTVSGNTIVDASGYGAGLANRGGTLTILNSTISGNRATTGLAGESGRGGGLYNSGGTVTLRHSTLAGNAADVDGGGIFQEGAGAVLRLGHTLLANAPYGNVMNNGGATIDEGFNLADDASAVSLAPNAGDLQLSPLADNGGPTLTHALLLGSPAIDAGTTGQPNAWQVADISNVAGTGVLAYTTNLTAAQRAAATNEGWRFRVVSRLVDGSGGGSPAHFMVYGNGVRRFYVGWDTNSAGQLTAALGGGLTTNLTAAGAGTHAYHTHELVYDPAAQQATYRFDGTDIATWGGSTPDANQNGIVQWGTGSSAGRGTMNYQHVQFAITGLGTAAEYDAGLQGSPAVAANPTNQGWTLVPPATPGAVTATPLSADTSALPSSALEALGLLDDQRGSGFPRLTGVRMDIGAFEGFLAPGMELAGNGLSIPQGDTTPSTADGTDFGAVPAAGGAIAQTFAIRNSGTLDLHLTGTPPVAVSGPSAAEFAVTVQPEATVPPGATNFFEVTFNPAGYGVRTATLSIASDNPNAHPYTFVLQGQRPSAPPVIRCPADLVVTGIPGRCGANNIDFGVTASGWPAPALIYSLGGQVIPAGHFFSPGAYVVTCTATNAAGTDTCSITLTVHDVEPPQLACPGDITVIAPTGASTAAVPFQVDATDNCGVAETAAVPASGSEFPIGPNLVTCTARDAAGNTSTCQFTVTVIPCPGVVMVTNTNDSGPGSLRQAVANACPGSTIAFDLSLVGRTIVLGNGELVIDKNLTILGHGADLLAISGAGKNRVIEIAANATVTIRGVAIRDGRSANGPAQTGGLPFPGPGEDGGGILNRGQLTLEACRLTANRTGAGGNDTTLYADGGNGGRGGAVFNAGKLVLRECEVLGNATGAGGGGGALAGSGGNGGAGGGIYNDTSATLVIEACVVSTNRTGGGGGGGGGGNGGDGGGLFTAGTNRVTASGSSLVGNATGDGASGASLKSGGLPGGRGGDGAAVFAAGPVRLTACAIVENHTGPGGAGGSAGTGGPAAAGGRGGSGGGVSAYADVELLNCTFGGNRAGAGGAGGYGSNSPFSPAAGGSGGAGGQGGGFQAASTASLLNCTFVSNAVDVGGTAGPGTPNGANGASGRGGGLAVAGAKVVSVANSILALNHAPGTAPDVAGTVTSLGHNLVGIVDGSAGFGAAGDRTGTSGAPLLPGLGPLADNGGPTLTHALLPGSPALDAGSPNPIPGLDFDQRGPGFPRRSGVTVDIGAFEFQVAAAPPGFIHIESLAAGVLLRLQGAPNESLSLEWNGTLDAAGWRPLATGPTDAAGVLEYTDTAAAGAAARFYRAVRP
jgi:hypothetical protein